jgi:hypothetical protein
MLALLTCSNSPCRNPSEKNGTDPSARADDRFLKDRFRRVQSTDEAQVVAATRVDGMNALGKT